MELALQLDNSGRARYLAMGDPSDYDPQTALFIEVARKAANGRGIDVPRSIISHVLRKRIDKRPPLTNDILVGVLKNNSLPTLAEMANNLILYLNEHQPRPGILVQISTNHTAVRLSPGRLSLTS
jgi:hypothetical protein